MYSQLPCLPARPARRSAAKQPRGVLAAALLGILWVVPPCIVHAQTDERWYQIEISIFAHENAGLGQELWPEDELPDEFPANGRLLSSRMDVLDLADWDWLTQPVRFQNPIPQRESSFRLPDIERDAFVELPAAEQSFTDTNRALTASADYRLLWHSAWRQPLELASSTRPLLVTGGRQFGERHELEGSLLVGFNPGRDRVVVSTDMWLTQFSALPPEGLLLELPELPEALQPQPEAADINDVDSDPSGAGSVAA